jgi:hypothetical protein
VTKQSDRWVANASVRDLARVIELAADPAVMIYRLRDPHVLAEVLDGLAEADEMPDGARLVSRITAGTASGLELIEVRRRAGVLGKRAVTPRQKASTDMLSHAAVAAAFAWYGLQISRRPISARQRLFKDLADCLHAGPIAAVFREAGRR